MPADEPGIIEVFQSTRPRGARRDQSGCKRIYPQGFNPRAREGRDKSRQRRCAWKRCFNPRAREGRDQTYPSIIKALPRFNPRAREGRDEALRIDNILVEFQSTRPRGARHCLTPGQERKSCFNPRAREGRDRRGPLPRLPRAVFQSTRPRGARLARWLNIWYPRQFQSTRPRGARQPRYNLLHLKQIKNIFREQQHQTDSSLL